MIRDVPQDTRSGEHAGSVLRRFEGVHATELYLLCRPDPSDGGGAEAQAESVCRALAAALRAEGAQPSDVVRETVFFGNIREDLAKFRQARRGIFEHADAAWIGPASTFIEQAPLDPATRLEISAFAVIPHDRGSTRACHVWAPSACDCADCSRVDARVSVLGGDKYLSSGNIYGARGSAFDEAYSMFCSAQELLRSEGMGFQQVVRTWIHIREMERDYDDLNRARRQFFESVGIERRPASTGIQGGPFPSAHKFSMGVYAVAASGPVEIGVMTTPTLNEAWTYGVDFSRGLAVTEANKTALYVSGTASVDEEGRTTEVGDFAGQVDRMLVNVSTLLRRRGASFGDLVSAVTYLKNVADAPVLRTKLREQGLEGIPNAIVRADVCRPDLLCEIEAIAALPRPCSGK